MIIGVISDTHGLLRASALAALAGSDRIIHAGDVGSASVLEKLAMLAPLTVVRGNNDTESWSEALPEKARLRCEQVDLLIVHDLNTLKAADRNGTERVIIAGHSHQPAQREAGGVLYLNPGSAGPRRFRLPICVAQLAVSGSEVQARIIELAP
jgi:putative phosphoesterase